jgi:hypothetical protein
MSQDIRMVYNDDGTGAMGKQTRIAHVKEDLEQWIDWILDGTPVDAYVHCTAHPEVCYHETKVGERIGKRFHAAGRVIPGHFEDVAKKHDELEAQGTDMLRVFADRAHLRNKRIFAGLRMSDSHHCWGGPYEESALYSRFAHENPEYHIRTGLSPHPKPALDYTFEGVREKRLAMVKELAERYPTDGIELDFMRHCVNFPSPATKEQVRIMTKFVGRVRKTMDRAAKKRGLSERLILGVRVPSTLTECPTHGLDPRAWARKGWIDYLNAANTWAPDANTPVGDFVKALEGSGCRLLTALQPYTSSTWGKKFPAYDHLFPTGVEELKAVAANGFAAGAEGVHYFNFCCIMPEKKDYVVESFAQLATRDAVFKGTRHYQWFPLDSVITATWAQNYYSAVFERQRLNRPHTIRFLTADGNGQANPAGQLAFRIGYAQPGDQWSFRLNGQPLDPGKMRSEHRPETSPLKDVVFPAHLYVEMDLAEAPALRFENEIEVTALRFDPARTDYRTLEVLEVRIRG